MAIELKTFSGSIAPTLVQMLSKHIGVELKIHALDQEHGENKTDEHTKLDLLEKVPMIVEEEFVLKESTAICYYLLNKYAPYSDLYPKDLRRRARVDEILATVTIRIQPKISEFYSVCLRNKRKPSAEQVQDLEDGVIVPLQRLVGDGKFVLGNSPTLADLCIAAHIAGVVPCIYYSREKFPKLTAYYDLISVELPYFKEICQPGIDARNKMWSLTQ